MTLNFDEPIELVQLIMEDDSHDTCSYSGIYHSK